MFWRFFFHLTHEHVPFRDSLRSSQNETLEERRARKERERNAQMAAKFGYSNEENPFNDPNLNESFTWGKKVQLNKGAAVPVAQGAEKKAHQEKLVSEIEKVRRRRIEREEEKEEMDRLREEESRLREMAHYDDWQRKEEEVSTCFVRHLTLAAFLAAPRFSNGSPLVAVSPCPAASEDCDQAR